MVQILLQATLAAILAMPSVGQVPDTALAHRRRMVDSISAVDRAAAASRPRSQARRDGGPFDEYQWAFYGTIAAGMIMGILAFVLRHRDAQPAAKRLWGVAGALIGLFIGAIAFVSVFMFFGILSVGFSPLPVPVMFACALLATAFALAWLMSLRYRRLR
jgi:hypothetical protein